MLTFGEVWIWPLHPNCNTATMLSLDEVRKHVSRESCWVIISGQVYDVTDFLDEHPGGAGVILRCAGTVWNVSELKTLVD